LISKFKEIEELFHEIESKLDINIRLYAIGGAVLIERGLKPSTKDIDLVVDTKDEFTAINKALTKIGFEQKEISNAYEHFDLAHQLVRGDTQIDLFHKKVCSKFSLSKNMMKRAEKSLSKGKINMYLCSNEDIFLFKTMTEREGDLEDCISLAQTGLNWKTILQEMKHQIKNQGRDVWVTWIGERLDLLEDKGLNIPIMKEINKLREEYFNKLEERQKQR
jgi:hypothetical protein